MTTHTPAELTRIRQLARGDCVQFDYSDRVNLSAVDTALRLIRTWQTNGALAGGRYSIIHSGQTIRVVRL